MAELIRCVNCGAGQIDDLPADGTGGRCFSCRNNRLVATASVAYGEEAWTPEPEEMSDETWEQLCEMADPDADEAEWDECVAQEMLQQAAAEIARLRGCVEQLTDTIDTLGAEHDLRVVAIQMLREALEPFAHANMGGQTMKELVADPVRLARKVSSSQGSFSH